MAEFFKTFTSTVSPWVPGPERPNQMLVDSITNAPVGLRNLGTQGPDAIIAPVDVTTAQIASPPAAMLADVNSTFRLSVPPYTRYYSNGTTLVQIGGGGGGSLIPITSADVASPSAPILAALGATYQLNVAPYTRYYSDGIELLTLTARLL